MHDWEWGCVLKPEIPQQFSVRSNAGLPSAFPYMLSPFFSLCDHTESQLRGRNKQIVSWGVQRGKEAFLSSLTLQLTAGLVFTSVRERWKIQSAVSWGRGAGSQEVTATLVSLDSDRTADSSGDFENLRHEFAVSIKAQEVCQTCFRSIVAAGMLQLTALFSIPCLWCIGCNSSSKLFAMHHTLILGEVSDSSGYLNKTNFSCSTDLFDLCLWDAHIWLFGYELHIDENNLIASSIGLPITRCYNQMEAKYEIGSGTAPVNTYFSQNVNFFSISLNKRFSTWKKWNKIC